MSAFVDVADLPESETKTGKRPFVQGVPINIEFLNSLL